MKRPSPLSSSCCRPAAQGETFQQRRQSMIDFQRQSEGLNRAGYATIAAKLYNKQDAEWCSRAPSGTARGGTVRRHVLDVPGHRDRLSRSRAVVRACPQSAPKRMEDLRTLSRRHRKSLASLLHMPLPDVADVSRTNPATRGTPASHPKRTSGKRRNGSNPGSGSPPVAGKASTTARITWACTCCRCRISPNGQRIPR